MNAQEKAAPSPNSTASAEASHGSNAQEPEHAGDAEAQTAGASSTRQRLSTRTLLGLLALYTAFFLAALDQTIITVALPTIATDLQASQADYSWVGSTYLLAGAAAMPMWGKVSDIFGRKPILLLANSTFFVGSLICALSIDIGMLEAGRVIQGAGAGGLMTLVNICISDMFSMRERGFYMGIIGLIFAVASAIGPVIGGAFAEHVTWRWGFWINLPFNGIAFALIILFLELHNPRTPLKAGLNAIDWLGFVSIITGTAVFLIGLELGGVSYPWSSATVVCLLVFGIVIIALFVLVEHRLASNPIVPLHILTSRSNAASLSANFCHGLVFMAGTYYLPFYFQAVLGATPLLAGVYLLPYIITLSLMATASGIIIKRTGTFRLLITSGLALMTLGFGLFIDLPAYGGWARIVVFQILAGLGVGCLFQSPLVALQVQVHKQDIASVTGVFGFSRNLSTAISVCIGGAILQNQIATRVGPDVSGLPSAVAQALQGGWVGTYESIPASVFGPQRDAVLNVFTDSLRVLWVVCTAIAGFGLLCSLAIKSKPLDTTHEAAKTGLEKQQGEKQRAK